jgi:hypothetical protein
MGLDNNQLAEVDEFEDRMKELEAWKASATPYHCEDDVPGCWC